MKKFRIAWIVIVVLVTVFFAAYRVNEIRKTDSSGPVFSCEDTALQISIKDGDDVLLEGVTASDKKDGDVTSSILVEKLSGFDNNGKRTVTYAAFDSDNHVTEMERELTYTDYVSPRFTLTSSLRFRAGEMVNVDQIVKATDCLDGDISNKVKILLDDVINNRVPGFYKIRYEVSNSAGDMVTLPVEVEIYEASAGDVKLNLNQYLVYYEGENINFKDYLKSVRIGSVETPFEGVLLEGMENKEPSDEQEEDVVDDPEADAEDPADEDDGEDADDGEEGDADDSEADGEEEDTVQNRPVEKVIPKSRVTVRSEVNTSVPGVYPVYFDYSDAQNGYGRKATEVMYVVVEG